MTPARAVTRALSALRASGSTLDYENLLAAGYKRFLKEGDVVVDVGAHVAFHFERFQQILGPTGTLVGFEPLPGLAQALKERFAGVGNVRIHQAALSREAGRQQFRHVRSSPGYSGLRERIYDFSDPNIELIDVEVLTFDSFIDALPRINYVKIDIEGGEIDCLEGATKILARTRPLISVEYGYPSYSGYGHTKFTLYDWAARNDYQLSDLCGNLIASRDEWADICDAAFWDFFVVPREQALQWEAYFRD